MCRDDVAVAIEALKYPGSSPVVLGFYHLPQSVLHYFACDCIWYSLGGSPQDWGETTESWLRELVRMEKIVEQEGMGSERLLLGGLVLAKRKWVEGGISDEKLWDLRMRVIGPRSISVRYSSSSSSAWFLSSSPSVWLKDVTLLLCSPSRREREVAENTRRIATQVLAWHISVHGKIEVSFNQNFRLKRHLWQHKRLRELLEEFQQARATLLRKIFDFGKVVNQKGKVAGALWGNETEEALFF